MLACSSAAWADQTTPASASGTSTSTQPQTNGSTSSARPQQEVALIAEAATVFIGGEWTGYVEFPTSNGLAWSTELTADFSCSGFIASSDGNVVTAGHCADPAEGKPMLVDAFLDQQVQAGNITQADAQEFVDEGAETQWAVQGLSNGSQPTLTMKVYQNESASGIQVSDGMTATVIDNRPLEQGDVTLLKVTSPMPLPTLQLAPSGPNVGDTVDAVGYPGSVGQVVDSNVEATFAQGQVGANQQTSNGAPFTEVSAAMSPGMSGGPVVDDQGRVIGTVSFGPSQETQQLNFAAGWDTVKSLLARNGVNTTPSAADVAYRQGLDLYFAQKYREAAAAFTTVLNTEPSNSYAQEYKGKAVSQEASEPQSAAAGSVGSAGSAGSGAAIESARSVSVAGKSSSTPVALLLVVGALLAAVAVWVLARRRRPNPSTAAVDAMYSQPQAGYWPAYQGQGAQPVSQSVAQPVAHQPVAHQPVAHQPVAHQPVAHQTIAHQTWG